MKIHTAAAAAAEVTVCNCYFECYVTVIFHDLQALYWWGRLSRSKMKDDGANEEDWVSGVVDLVGIGG
jgi:hypothetical protein